MSASALVQSAAGEGVKIALSDAGKIRLSGVRSAVEKWQGRIAENKLAIVAMLSGPDGNVPPRYANALARLQCQALPGVPQDWQERAARLAVPLLNRHGAALARLGWHTGALFDSPVVLATSGASAALDLRRAGLAWQLREGDTVGAIEASAVRIRLADGSDWTFQQVRP